MTGYVGGRYYPTRVSMQLQPLNQRKLPSVKAVGNGTVHATVRKGFGFGSKNKRPSFACNSALVGSIFMSFFVMLKVC